VRWIRVALPVYWVAVVAATHYPRVQIPGEIPKSDKLVHFAAFGMLALLFWRLLAARGLTARSVWLAAAVLIPYATIDEYTQQFVGRHTELADWIANIAGIVTVLAPLEIRRRYSCAQRTRS
jgi:VanZ family protein